MQENKECPVPSSPHHYITALL